MNLSKMTRVLVPFYRGAVVFNPIVATVREIISFSSPFIEERLYFSFFLSFTCPIVGSRPLLSRSGCIFDAWLHPELIEVFSSPFIEERLYLQVHCKLSGTRETVLVPFYRGAVVFVQGWADNGVRVF